MNDETWEKLVKVASPNIRKIKMSNVSCVFFYFTLYISDSSYLSLQSLFILYFISISCGNSLHIMALSLTWMSLMPLIFFQRRWSRLGRMRLGKSFSIRRMINFRQNRTRFRQGSCWRWRGVRLMDGSTSCI